MFKAVLFACALALCASGVFAGLKAGECEVCIKVVETVKASLDKKDLKSKDKIAAAIRKYCKTAKDRENRFCYYVGGTEDAATGLLNVISEPLTNGIPPEKICERTKSKDLQICELRYCKSYPHRHRHHHHHLISSPQRTGRRDLTLTLI